MVAIRELEPSDVPRAVEVLRHAFAVDPALAWLLPDPDHRALVEPHLARAFCKYAMEWGKAWCTDDVSGVALRRPPGEESLRWLGVVSSGIALLPFHLGLEATRRLLSVEEAMGRQHAAVVQGPHWTLWTLGVDPERQGEGLGGALMRHTFAASERDGVPCYLETTSRTARAIHANHGFRVAGELDLGGLTVWSMVRDAGCTSSARSVVSTS